VIDLSDLTRCQRDVYDATEPLVLVTGGPGTGKTAVALLTARHLLEREPETSSRRVLFLTFSRAAVHELTTRLPRVLRPPLGERVEIQTFHSFATMLLNQHRRFDGGGPEPVVIYTEVEEALGLVSDGELPFKSLLPAALALLDRAPWLRDEYQARYVAVICDEYQDTGPDQDQLLRFLTPHAQLICLADMNQMIYDGLPDSGVSARRIDDLRARGPREIQLEPSSHRDPTNLTPRLGRAFLERDFDAAVIREAMGAHRLNIIRGCDPLATAVVDEVRRLGSGTARSIGVFVTQKVMVDELADRFRSEGIEHEIAGLGAASAYAQLAAAALAGVAVGKVGWDVALQRIGLFCAASSSRRRIPALAYQLVSNQQDLPAGLVKLLLQAQTHFLACAGGPVGEFLVAARAFWPQTFVGERGARLWEWGLDDLMGQTLAMSNEPLDTLRVTALAGIASARHTTAMLELLPDGGAPVKLMTFHQAKGRELDAVIFVHDPRDITPRDVIEAKRTARLHYVAITRARQSVTILLPPQPSQFWEPYAGS